MTVWVNIFNIRSISKNLSYDETLFMLHTSVEFAFLGTVLSSLIKIGFIFLFLSFSN